MTHNLSLVVMVAGALGLVLLAVRFRMRPAIWPVLSLLVFAPFFVVALHQGQRPLHVEEITSDLYNVRFGLVMILPLAIGAGYLASLVSGKVLVAVGALAALTVIAGNVLWFSDTDNIVTMREPVVEKNEPYYVNVHNTANFLRTNYAGGLVLMESFGNEQVLFAARIDFSNNVYEGSYRQWEPALAQPDTQRIEWIVMRGGNAPDKVHATLSGSEVLASSYALVYQDDLYQVYERKETSGGG